MRDSNAQPVRHSAHLRVALFSCLLEAAHGIQFIDRHADTSMMSQPDPTQRDRDSLLRSLAEVLDGLTGIRFNACRTRESNRGADRESENEYEKSRGAERARNSER